MLFFVDRIYGHCMGHANKIHDHMCLYRNPSPFFHFKSMPIYYIVCLWVKPVCWTWRRNLCGIQDGEGNIVSRYRRHFWIFYHLLNCLHKILLWKIVSKIGITHNSNTATTWLHPEKSTRIYLNKNKNKTNRERRIEMQ